MKGSKLVTAQFLALGVHEVSVKKHKLVFSILL